MDEVTLKRLRYRSWHRGCKETDLVLGNFSEKGLGALEPAMLAVYERLLDENDIDIWNWLTDKEAPSAADYVPLLTLLKNYGLPGN